MVSFSLRNSEKCLLQSLSAQMCYVENDSVSQKVNRIIQEALLRSVITDVEAEMLLKLLPKLKFLQDSYKENICSESNNDNDWDIREDELNVVNRRKQLAEIHRRFSNWVLMQYIIYQKQINDNMAVKRRVSLKENKKKSIKNKGVHKKIL